MSAGGAYAQTQSVVMPSIPSGNYFLILSLDADGSVFETNEFNNTSVRPITITNPDLVPTVFNAPAAVNGQQSFTVSWTITNSSVGVAVPNWAERIFLSTNAILDGQDIPVFSFTHFGGLPAGAAYSATQTVSLPGVVAGNYFLILRTDADSSLLESSEANNDRAVPVSISTPDLITSSLIAPGAVAVLQSISV